jgi:tRNA A37 threonylcarbamoyladenosine dehydratase
MIEDFCSRTAILLTEAELHYLTQQHVFIAGLGGVGSYVAEILGRVGMQRLTILDHDVVAFSNLNRQLVALHSTIGHQKAEVMAKRLRDINPNVQLTVMTDFLEKHQAESVVIQGNFDFVIDCIDSIACKAELVAACVRHEIPVASSMGAGNRLDVTQVKITKLNQTAGCALARELRGMLRKMGVKTNYPVVFSTEIPRQPLPHQAVSSDPPGRARAVNGSIAYLPALFGVMLAGYVIKTLLDKSASSQQASC